MLSLAAGKDVSDLGGSRDGDSKENGGRRINGVVEDTQYNGTPNGRPDELDDHPVKSRYSFNLNLKEQFKLGK